MRRTRGRVVDVETLEEFDRRLAHGARALDGWHLQGIDLRERDEELKRVRVAGALFVGCRLTSAAADSLTARGAVLFPDLPGLPVDPYRGSLYSADELYTGLADGAPYADTLDARAYAWSRLPPEPEALLARVLHDHAMDRALEAWIRRRRLVGVMGGHALVRGEPGYAEAARLGRALASSAVVATGGGPGAMEAANLGARLSSADPAVTEEALARLAQAPSFAGHIDSWARAALEVTADVEDPTPTLGIPTWHYGHEPPNAFATAIAKYFRNSTREAILLEVCSAGIVFLPGAAGTVQEIFQDACENYYADDSTPAPMVLVGHAFWTETLPAWPLLKRLAGRRDMARHIHLVDDLEEAAALIAAAAPPMA